MASVINQDAVIALISHKVRDDIRRAQDAVMGRAQEELRKRLQGIVAQAALTLSAEYSVERLGNIIRIEVKTDG